MPQPPYARGGASVGRERSPWGRLFRSERGRTGRWRPSGESLPSSGTAREHVDPDAESSRARQSAGRGMSAGESTHAQVRRRFDPPKETDSGDRAREPLERRHVAPDLATLPEHDATVGLRTDLGQRLLDGCQYLAAPGRLVDPIDGRHVGGQRLAFRWLRVGSARREQQHRWEHDEISDAAKREHKLAAEHVGELLVDDRYVEGVRLEHRNRGCSVGGLGGFVTCHLKGHQQASALVGLRLRDKDGPHDGWKIPPRPLFNQPTWEGSYAKKRTSPGGLPRRYLETYTRQAGSPIG